MNKYGARACTSVFFPGVAFPSQAERDRAEYLLSEERDGKIRDLALHQRYVLSTKPRCVFTVDAQYTEAGALVVEDTKGAVARDFPVRVAFFKHLFPEIRVRIVKRDRRAGWLVKDVA